MKDADVRGLVLKALYDVRHTTFLPMIPDDLPNLPRLDVPTLRNITNQLNEKGLIKFTPIMGGPNVIGRAGISAEGVDVVERTAKSPITVTFDHSVNVHGS